MEPMVVSDHIQFLREVIAGKEEDIRGTRERIGCLERQLHVDRADLELDIERLAELRRELAEEQKAEGL